MKQNRSFFPEPLSEHWQAPLKDTEGVCRSLFFSQSVFEDNILYAEYKRNRFPKSLYSFYLQKNSSKLLPEEIQQTLSEMSILAPVRTSLQSMKTYPVLSKEKELQKQDLLSHFAKNKKHFLLVNNYLNKQQQSLLAEHLLSKFKKPTQSKQKSWDWADQPTWNFFAHVETEKQDHLLQTLQSLGAEMEENLFEVQEYASVHKIVPGHRLSLQTEHGHISFVPRGKVGEQTITNFSHSVCLQKPDQEQMFAAMCKYWKKRLFSMDDLVLVHYEKKDADGKTISQEDKIEVWRWLKSKKREAFKQGEIFKQKVDVGFVVEESVKSLQIENLQKDSAWVKMHDDLWMRQKNHEVWKESWQAYLNLPEQIQIVWESKFEDAPKNHQPDEESDDESIVLLSAKQENEQTNWTKLSKSLHIFLTDKKLPRVLKAFFLDGPVLAQQVKWQSNKQTKTVDVLQEAPRVEQGQIRAIGYAHPEKAMEDLQRIGLADSPLNFENLPSAWQKHFENCQNPLGRIAIVHEDYKQKDNKIILPEGNMVLHGMTGVDHAAEALNRLEKICQMGGLLSIAERRRIGLSLLSMSPRGDIASGLDGAVPCKIGTAPHYGSLVFFGMHPKVLKRRDVFFAPLDYGAGKDRYPMFQSYAKQIGQADVYHPPCHHSRIKHLETGLQNPHNEVYFRHQIGWDEIDTVWVHYSIWEQTNQKWELLQKQFDYLHNTRIESFSDNLSQLIIQRAKQL